MTILPCPNCGQELTIPSGVSTLACVSCDARLTVLHTGGILALKADEPPKTDLDTQIRKVKAALDATVHEQMVGVPAYVLLRHDFLWLRKLQVWNVSVASEEILEKIFLNLTMKEMDTLIKRYSTFENSKTLPWLVRVRDLRKELESLEAQQA